VVSLLQIIPVYGLTFIQMEMSLITPIWLVKLVESRLKTNALTPRTSLTEPNLKESGATIYSR